MGVTPYQAICEYYEGKKAKRSGVPYINHINEGHILLGELNTGENAVILYDAFSLHPFYQDKVALPELSGLADSSVEASKRYAEQYAFVADNLLRHNYEQNGEFVALSRESTVWKLLVADKVQNFKDARANSSKYAEWCSIEQYFLWWFDKLQLSHTQLKSLIKRIE